MILLFTPAVFEHLLQHRPMETLHVDIDLKPSGSVYDLTDIVSEPKATPAEVERIIVQVEADYTPEALEKAIENWYKI